MPKIEIREIEKDLGEEDDEAFDRLEFAAAAIDLVRPPKTRIALCTSASRLRIESGRVWGRGDARWAMLSVPERASKRAIVLAVAELARGSVAPWALDVLLGSDDPYRS
jgi:hypothetical protein